MSLDHLFSSLLAKTRPIIPTGTWKLPIYTRRYLNFYSSVTGDYIDHLYATVTLRSGSELV